MISTGCELPQLILSEELGLDAVQTIFEDLGFFTYPGISPLEREGPIPPLVLSPQDIVRGQSEFRVSPLQMSLAAATLSSGGSRPIPILVSALNRPDTGWTVFLPSWESHQVFSKPNADGIAGLLSHDSLPIWESVATTMNEPDQVITWYLGGTSPTWTGAPISLVIVLEEDSPEEALAIGQAMLKAALQIE